MKTEMLKTYIEKIYKLETSLYAQRKVQESIRRQLENVANVRYEEYRSLYSMPMENKEDDGLGLFLIWLGLSIVASICWLVFGITTDVMYRWSIGGIFVRGGISGIFLTIIYMGYVDYKIEKEKKEVRRANQYVYEVNQEISQKNAMLEKTVNQKIAILNQELNELRKIYENTEYILKKYYDENIIFTKYRNIVAISSFYEYFISGRCCSLEGHEGAYNIYENEIRQNIIISKLDEVIYHLEQIEENQYMIYQAIKESNKKVEKISREISSMADNLQSIEGNTALLEYHTENMAQNVEFMKWIEFYRN